MLLLRRQCRPPSASRPRIQSRQLHANAGPAQGGGALVADQPAREADQDSAKVVSHGRYVTFQMAEVRGGYERRPRRHDRGDRDRCHRRRRERCVSDAGKQRVSALGAVYYGFDRPLRIRRAIYLVQDARRSDPIHKTPGIWGMSVKIGVAQDRSRRGNRLDQAWVIVLDVADARAHRPADYITGRVGGSRDLSCGSSAGSSPSHTGHASGFRVTGMRLWISAHNSLGVVVMIAKLRTHSPTSECQFFHKPASAMMPRSTSASA